MEPAMFGVILKYKTPMIGVCIGSFVGSCFAGIWGVRLYTLVGTSGLFALPGYICDEPRNFIGAVISVAIGVAVSFVATMLLYKEGKNKPKSNQGTEAVQEAESAQETASAQGKEAPAAADPGESRKPCAVYAPFSGKAMKLEDFPDAMFAQKLMGPGCGVEPAEDTVYAPFDGRVTMVTDTGHAIGLSSADGVEVLIHVGVDTVEMGGKGFSYLVKQDQEVKKGQPLLNFSREAIQASGHPATTAVVVTNGDEFADVQLSTEGEIQRGDLLLSAAFGRQI